MYTINANQIHPSIQSGHIPEFTAHPFEPGGIAEREDQFNFASFHRLKNSYQLSKSRTQKKTIYALSRQKKQQASRSVCDTATLIDSWLRKAKSEGKDYITTTHANISYEREICLRTSKYLLKRLVDVGFISVQTIHDPSYGRCLYIQYTDQASIVLEGLALPPVKQPKQTKRKVISKDLQRLQTTGCKFCTIKTAAPYVVRARNKNYITQDNHKDFYLCSANNIKCDKVIYNMKEKHGAESIEATTFSATLEQPQDRIALKSNEAKGNIYPFSETPTKPTERKKMNKEKPTPSLKLQASSRPQTERAEEKLNAIAEETYEEFLILFKPEEDKRFKCYRSDFLRLVKARIKSHLGCVKDIKTYMRKFAINQYLMGRRIQKDGTIWRPSVYGLFSPSIIDDYQKKEYSRYFTPYNELDLSKKEEEQDVAVPQEFLQKISLALLEANEQTEAYPEQTQDILKIIRSYAVQKMEKQKSMTQTPERKPNELNPLPVLRSSSGDQATISVANQERSWLKKGESYWQTLNITCRKQWEDDFIATIRSGETGFRVDQDIHDPMFRKFKTVPFMTWIGKILEQEERQENNISPETEIEEIESIIPDLAEPEDVEFEDFPREELEQSDSEGLWVTHFQNKSAFYGQNVRRTLHTLLLFASLWQSAQAVEIKSCFTPQQQCLPLIVTELQNAQSEILMQAYSLTSKPISKALREAHDRGVKVKILVDPSQEKSSHSQVGLLKESGIDVMVDDKVRIAHNKVIVIDGKTLIGGSYNFSAAAEKHNAENLIIVKDDPVVQEYRQNWWNRFGKSRVLKMLLRPRL